MIGENIILSFLLPTVVGDAKDIDWYSPSGEKILPNRPDIFVSRSDESTSTLTIYHASTDNAGIYKCVAKNGDKEAQSTVQVKIFRKSCTPVLSRVPLYSNDHHYVINISNAEYPFNC